MIFVMKAMLVIYPYSNDDDFIGDGLGGMGCSCKLYKKTIPNCKFLRGWFQTNFFLKINIFQVVMFQNVLIDTKISKEKQIFLFFSMFFGIFVSFQKNLEPLWLSNFIQM